MKNRNCYLNKGFTLIELLAVIVLLSIILLITVPNAVKYINSTEENLTSIQEKNIIDAAKLYYEDCSNSSIDENTQCNYIQQCLTGQPATCDVKFSTLKTIGFFKDSIKNIDTTNLKVRIEVSESSSPKYSIVYT